MKYIDGFRASAPARTLAADIRTLAGRLTAAGRTATIMEVCGTHTMAIARHGVRDILPPGVDLVSGPGCPVCVTEPGYIDTAVKLARDGVIIATFGDMIHVPGSDTTLSFCRAEGARVEVCYSPLSAVELARDNPACEVVFLAIGFETTIPPVVSIVDAALRAGVRNVSLLTAFKLVPPALRALLDDPELAIDAFLCPAHVSAVIGSDAYRPFVGNEGVPCVVAGFEPLDILLGLRGILEQIVAGEARLDNQYSRVVKPGGNPKALAVMDRFLRPCDAVWRGVGCIPGSGLELRPEYATFDTTRKLGVTVQRGREHPGCLCGDVVKGKVRPPSCPLFGRVCTPDHPIGPCMVSVEGTCAAYYKYSRLPPSTPGSAAAGRMDGKQKQATEPA